MTLKIEAVRVSDKSVTVNHYIRNILSDHLPRDLFSRSNSTQIAVSFSSASKSCHSWFIYSLQYSLKGTNRDASLCVMLFCYPLTDSSLTIQFWRVAGLLARDVSYVPHSFGTVRTQRHSVTCHKTWVFNYTAMRGMNPLTCSSYVKGRETLRIRRGQL
jgi:hypothetical protein